MKSASEGSADEESDGWDVVSLVSSADLENECSPSQEWTSGMALHHLWSNLTTNITERVQVDCERFAQNDSTAIVAQVYRHIVTVEEYLAIAGKSNTTITMNSVLAYFELLLTSSPGVMSYSFDCLKVSNLLRRGLIVR